MTSNEEKIQPEARAEEVNGETASNRALGDIAGYLVG
jgi:hypothetical protein